MSARAGRWAIGALAFAVAGFGCTKASKTVPAGVEWNSAFDAALADAQAHHRPILLDFYTDW